MKKLILLISSMLMLVGCQAETSEEITPELLKVAGKWKLYKISIGFRSSDGRSEEPITSEQIIEFNTTSKVFTRTIAGKITATMGFEVRAISNYNNTAMRDAIIFTKSNTYSFLSFDEATSSLVLYEESPMGAELADGNSYHYQKIK